MFVELQVYTIFLVRSGCYGIMSSSAWGLSLIYPIIYERS